MKNKNGLILSSLEANTLHLTFTARKRAPQEIKIFARGTGGTASPYFSGICENLANCQIETGKVGSNNEESGGAKQAKAGLPREGGAAWRMRVSWLSASAVVAQGGLQASTHALPGVGATWDRGDGAR